MVNYVLDGEADKQSGKTIQETAQDCPGHIDALMIEMRVAGPVRGNWPNYSKLSDTEHHCHIKKGKPTYVAVWREDKEEIRLVEVIYAGTHEKAPY